jgi:ABC-type branched-subunit amino acid transport system ATPase component
MSASAVETTAAPARLECAGVTVRFGGLVAVNEVSLAVPPAAIVGLVGPNGAGKSTLFGVLSGLQRPAAGRVLLEGTDVTDARPQRRAELGLARTFQHSELFGGLSVRDHLVLAYRVRHARRRVWSDLFTMGSLHRVDPSETGHVDELLELAGLGPVADHPARGLPLGWARLVELGRALATSPRVLLLDEPSSGLDSSETAQLETVLRRVAGERGVSVLLVEHDIELVMRLCSSVYVLDFGTLIADGTPGEITSSPQVRAAYLGEQLSAGPADEPAEAVVMAAGGAGRATAAAPADAAGSAGPKTELIVEDLSVHYGDAVALSGLTFSVGAGRVLAVLGANGAGKSSMARAVSGLVRASGGSVRFAGEEISGWAAHQIRRVGLLHLPEGRGVFRQLTVGDNLRMAVYQVPGRQARREAMDLVFTAFPVLASRRRQLAGSLSGGEQQMLSLARALATSPKLLIADELSLGLAPKMVDLVFEGVARARDAGVSVIMIEQYVHRALAFADDCLVLQRGTLAWSGSADAAHGEVLSRYLGPAMTAAS